MHPIPIHHTLENATISYDTMEPDFQKELVKDVFFSPPMTTPVRELSPCSSSSSSTCEEPSELLYQDYRHDNIFDFGLDLATTTHTTSSYEEVKMASSFNNINKNTNKRRCSDSVLQERKKQRFNNFLTSPPESPYSKHEYSEDDNARYNKKIYDVIFSLISLLVVLNLNLNLWIILFFGMTARKNNKSK